MWLVTAPVGSSAALIVHTNPEEGSDNNDKAPPRTICLLEGVPLLVGRSRVCAIRFADDPLVSRRHAQLTLQHAPTIANMGATAGLFVDGAAMSKGESCTLRHGSTIRCGTNMTSTIAIKQAPLLVCGSQLSTEAKQRLRRIVTVMGGEYRDKWTDLTGNGCTHLVMDQAAVTQKYLLALIDNAIIVTSAWFLCATPDTLLKRAESVVQGKTSQPIPYAASLPPVEAFSPVSAGATPDAVRHVHRRTLFAGITFLFLCERQAANHERIIQRAGGIVWKTSRDEAVDGAGAACGGLWQTTRRIILIDPRAPDGSVAAKNVEVLRTVVRPRLLIVSDSVVPLAILQGNVAALEAEGKHAEEEQEEEEKEEKEEKEKEGKGNAAKKTPDGPAKAKAQRRKEKELKRRQAQSTARGDDGVVTVLPMVRIRRLTKNDETVPAAYAGLPNFKSFRVKGPRKRPRTEIQVAETYVEQVPEEDIKTLAAENAGEETRVRQLAELFESTQQAVRAVQPVKRPRKKQKQKQK